MASLACISPLWIPFPSSRVLGTPTILHTGYLDNLVLIKMSLYFSRRWFLLFLPWIPSCELVNGSSSGVPIKKGVVEKIGSTIPLSKGKEKKGQKGAKMKPDIEKDSKDPEASQVVAYP